MSEASKAIGTETHRGPDGPSTYGVEQPAQPGTEPLVFRYRTPDLKRRKAVVPLAASDILFSAVQVIRTGGENNLHAHTAMDGFWFVLAGRARFYGEGDRLIAEIGRHEGVFIPRGVSYWFESVGEELVELLQVEAFAQNLENSRIDYTPKTEATRNFQLFTPEGVLLAEQGPPLPK